MLYYQDEFVDWKSGKKELESEIRVQITNLRNQFFAKDKPGYVSVVYPGGKKQTNVTGFHELPRLYALELRGGEYGDWRYTPKMPSRDKTGRLVFSYHHEYMRESKMLTEKDVEFLWFLINKSDSVRCGDIKVVDPEADASKEAADMAKDIDLKFWIYGRGSHVSSNAKLLRSVASAFGIADIDKLGINQVRNQLFKVVDAGEKSHDLYVNAALFEKLIDSSGSLRIANVIREAIAEGTIVFNKQNTAWYFNDGTETMELLLKVKPAYISKKEMALIEDAISNVKMKGRILAFLGFSDFSSGDELRELDRTSLMKMCKDRELEVSPKDTVDALVEKLCVKLAIPPTSK